MAETAIEWATHVWNPTTGCDRVSPGCDHCYALTMAKRLKGMGQAKYQNDGDPRTSGPGFGLTMHADTMGDPLGWRKPRKVFVNSMSDLFHDKVDAGFIAHVFAVMALTPQHTYQVLTKRHGRLRSLLNDRAFLAVLDDYREAIRPGCGDFTWPLPNVWLGVSVESQQWADIRIPALLETPAAVRFLSCEPLLGPIDLAGPVVNGHRPRLTYWLDGRPGWGPEETTPTGLIMQPRVTGPRIDWVIVGGESGPGARPMHPDWARSIRDQCQTAGVPFFFKQWGEYGPLPKVLPDGSYDLADQGVTVANDGTVYQPGDLTYPDGPRYGEAIRAGHDKAHLHAMYRVGKKQAGRELDGRTWDEYPGGGR
jgi:protein gp37